MNINLKMIMEQFVKLDEKIAQLDEDTFDRLAPDSIDLGKCIEDLQKGLREFLDAERQNHDVAMAMVNCAEREDLLSHSWGRIQLLNQILGVEPKIREEQKI
jgi:hypothetical protein